MSYTELHKGTLTEIDLKGLTNEEWCRQECEKLGLEMNDNNIYNSYLEMLLDKHWEYKLLRGKLYLCEDEELEDGDLNYLKKNDDGTYTYLVQFYNGGTYIDEVLENMLSYQENLK